MARPKAKTLNSKVHGTKWSARALCRVVSRPVHNVAVGDILARDGAWDHKYVVTEVHSVEPSETNSQVHDFIFQEPALTFEVTVRNLGRFYSDDRFKPATRYSDSRIKITLSMVAGTQRKGGLHIVQPVGEHVPPTFVDPRFEQTNELVRHYESYHCYYWTIKDGVIVGAVAKHGVKVPAVPVMKKASVLAGQQPMYVPPPREPEPVLPPEAILAQFAL